MLVSFLIIVTQLATQAVINSQLCLPLVVMIHDHLYEQQ